MLQFAIIIPFRPKAESLDWRNECDLLHQTIQSIIQQTYAGFKVFVVYNDLPDNLVADERVDYVLFPYGHQTYEEIEIREELFVKFKKSTKMVVRRWDKARKLTYGSKLAKEAGCDYIMALDADDRLSNRLLAYLSKDAEEHDRKGWYINKGYLHRQQSNYLIRVPKNMRSLNGSTHILHADLLKIPNFDSLDWQDYNMFTDHGWVVDRMKNYYGVTIVPIPFAALVYIVHHSNISQVRKKEYNLNIKGIAKRIMRGVWLSNRLRSEFNIRNTN